MYLNIYRLKSLGGGRLDWSLAEPPPGWLVPEAAGGVRGGGARRAAFRHVHLCGALWEQQRLCQWSVLAAARHRPLEAAAMGQPQVQPDAGRKKPAALQETGSWAWADALCELLQSGRQTVSQSIFSEAHQNQPRTGWVLHMVLRVLHDLSNQP